MTIPLDADARSLFNTNDFGVECWLDGAEDSPVVCHYDAPGKDVDLPGIGVSSLGEHIEFASSTMPGLNSGDFITVDLTPVGGPVTRYKVRNVTPQDDGLTSIATLMRTTKA